MKDIQFITTQYLLAMLWQQITLQQRMIEAQAQLAAAEKQLAETQKRLIEAQRQTIEAQKRIDALTPKTPPDDKVHWHLASGKLSTEAANSDDLEELKAFRDWNVNFAREYIKPYVDPKVYGECLNQMTRGLAEKIAAAQTKAETKNEKPSTSSPEESRIIQLSLLKDGS